MNRIKITTAILLATLTLAACTNGEDDLTAPGQTLPPGSVYLTGSIAGRTDTRAAFNPDGSGTFATGDVWGLYTRHPYYPGYSHENIPFAVNSTVIRWEEMADPYNVIFSAHYPRQTSVNKPKSYPFDVAKAFQSGPDKADLLVGSATGSEDTNSAANPVSIPFRHLMHSLRILLTAGTGAGTIDADATVELLGMKSTIDVNLIDGTVYSNVSGDTPYPAVPPRQDENGQWYASFIVAPQSTTPDADWIKITLANGDTYIYKVRANLGGMSPILGSGERLTLNLTLTGKHKVELTSSDIAPWEGKDPIDGEIDMADARKITDLRGFIAALTAEEGTEAKPAHYTLGTDIELDYDDVKPLNGGSLQIEAKGYKVIDGAGRYTVTRGNRDGQAKRISILSSASTSLKLTRVTLDNEGRSIYNWFECRGGELTLGEGVKFGTLNPTTDAMITVSDGGTLTVDGATFTDDPNGRSEQWISAADAGTHLMLKNYEFKGAGGYISIRGGDDATTTPRLSLRPGAVKPVLLSLDVLNDFAILPTEGAFTDGDAAQIGIEAASEIFTVISVGSQVSSPGSLYTFFADPADGALRLALKASTPDELREALTDVSTDPARPTRILLTGDILVPEPTGNDRATYVLDGNKYVEIDGGTNGYTLKRKGTAPVFWVQKGASLRLTRLTMDGENKAGDHFIQVGGVISDASTLTLGNGFRLTRALAAGIDGTNGIWVNATLVMEDGAEITGNGTGKAVYISLDGTLHLKGGKISGNSGHGLYLSARLDPSNGDPEKPTVTVDNALPADSAFDVFLNDYAQNATTVWPGAESVITVDNGYPALTHDDLSRFTLTGVRVRSSTFTSGFALRLSADGTAIGLVATPQAAATPN